MPKSKGLWITINVDGIDTAVSTDAELNRTFLMITGPQIGDDPKEFYSPFGALPAEDDGSVFARVYHKLGAIVSSSSETLEGPYTDGEQRTAENQRRFLWLSALSPTDLIKKIAETFTLKVKRIPYKGDTQEYEAAVAALEPWCDSSTVKGSASAKVQPHVRQPIPMSVPLPSSRKINRTLVLIYFLILLVIVAGVGFSLYKELWIVASGVGLFAIVGHIKWRPWLLLRQ